MVGGAGGGGERQFPVGDNDNVVATDSADWLVYLVVLVVLLLAFLFAAAIL